MMKRKVGFVLFLLVTVSCQKKIERVDIAKLKGYWEIEKVVFEDGEYKEYTINESYDFFQMKKENHGIRQKVMPQLDGTFLTNDNFENFIVRVEGDRVYLDYKTSYAKWTEEIIKLTNEEFVVKNDQNKEYYYKKASKINLLDNGEKTK